MILKTRKNIRSQIESRLKSGETKEALLEELTAYYGNKTLIKKILSDIPSHETREKIIVYHKVLLFVLICITFIQGVFFLYFLLRNPETKNLFMLVPLIILGSLVWISLSPSRSSYLFIFLYGGLDFCHYSLNVFSSNCDNSFFCWAVINFWLVALFLSGALYLNSVER